MFVLTGTEAVVGHIYVCRRSRLHEVAQRSHLHYVQSRDSKAIIQSLMLPTINNSDISVHGINNLSVSFLSI